MFPGLALATAACSASSTPVVPVIPCLYPFDASNTEVVNDGYYGLPTQSLDKQTTTVTTIEAESNRYYAAYPTNAWAGTGVKLDFSGRKAFEIAFTPAALSNNTQAGSVGTITHNLFFYTSSINNPLLLIVEESDSGLFSTSLHIQSNVAYDNALSAQPPLRIGVYVDTISAAEIGIRFYLNNVEQVLTTSTISSQILSVTPIEEIVVGFIKASDAGKSSSFRFITLASEMTGTYPAGATDFCGNLI